MKTDRLKGMRKSHAQAIADVEDMKGLTARDAMIKPVIVKSGDNGEIIIKKLKSEKTHVCIVVNGDKHFLGEISELDLIRLFLAQVENEPLTEVLNIGYNRELKYMKAKEIINKHESTVRLDTPINEVIKLIYKGGFEYLPVLDKDKTVSGVVTPSSLLNLLEQH